MPSNPPDQTPEVKTPRTDAFFNRKPKPGDKPFLQEVRDTLESFERENAQLRAELEEARRDTNRLRKALQETIGLCGCALCDEDAEDLREAIEEIRDFAKAALTANPPATAQPQDEGTGVRK